MTNIYYYELLQQCVSAVGENLYLDNHPERDSSGGESSVMAEEQILETARKFIKEADDA